MPIYRMLSGNTSFDPEEVEVITGAYEDALSILQLSKETMCELLATRILSMALSGDRNRQSLCDRAVMQFKRFA